MVYFANQRQKTILSQPSTLTAQIGALKYGAVQNGGLHWGHDLPVHEQELPGVQTVTVSFQVWHCNWGSLTSNNQQDCHQQQLTLPRTLGFLSRIEEDIERMVIPDFGDGEDRDLGF